MNPHPHARSIALAASLLGFTACLLALLAPHMLTVLSVCVMGIVDLADRFSGAIGLMSMALTGATKLKRGEVKV